MTEISSILLWLRQRVIRYENDRLAMSLNDQRGQILVLYRILFRTAICRIRLQKLFNQSI